MSANAKRRPILLFGVHNDMVHRDLVTSGILEELASNYDIQFLVSPKTDRTELERFGKIAGVVRGGFARSWIWNLTAILSSIHTWTPISGNLSREYFNRKKDNNYSWDLRALVLANRLGLAPMLIKLGRLALSMRVERSLGLENAPNPGVVIAPTGLRDLIADDLVRWGIRRHVPTLFLQANSDVFNMKVPTVRAAYFGVWGDQSWYFARLISQYAPNRLKIVGSARFETYFKNKVDRCDARRVLGLPQDHAVILFCGATAAFDEPRALKQLDDWINTGIIRPDTIVLYKPHPKGQVKDAVTPVDLNTLKNVRMVPDSAAGHWTSPDLYPALFAASDAVISPYSTMGVEGAVNGLPVLCLGYHPGRFESYWKWAREFVHLQIYKDKIWCLRCHHETEFQSNVQALVNLIGNREVSEAARNEVRAVAVRDGRRFSERLGDCVDEVLREGNWEPSS